MYRATATSPAAPQPPVSLQPGRIALPWYEAEDWPVLHSLFLERDTVSQSYEAWRLRAQAAERRYTVDGYEVVRVIVRPEALLNWCTAHDRIIDLTARHDYAQELLAGSYLAA
jgi:hypothetical protein